MKAGKLGNGKVVHAVEPKINNDGGSTEGFQWVTVCDKKVICGYDPNIPLAAINCKKCLERAVVKKAMSQTAPEVEAKAETLLNDEHADAEKAVAKAHEKGIKGLKKPKSKKVPDLVEETKEEPPVETSDLKRDPVDDDLIKAFGKLVKKFNLKNIDEAKYVLNLIEKAPPKETDAELRLRISDSIKDYRAKISRDPWPNSAGKKEPQKDRMGVLKDLTPKEKSLITSGKKNIDEVMAMRKYKKEKKADKKRLREKVKESKKLRKKEEREARRLKKKRIKKTKRSRNMFGHKIGSLFAILDDLFEKGSTLGEMVEAVKTSGLYKGKRPAGKIKAHIRRLTRKKGYAVTQIHSVKEKMPKGLDKKARRKFKEEREMKDFFQVIIPEEKGGENNGEKV